MFIMRISCLPLIVLLLLPGITVAQTKVTGAQKSSPSGKTAAAAEVPKTPVQEPPALLTKEELSAGWISLFDGQTLFGWKAHSDANWKVDGGAIVVTSGKPGLLCTSVQFDNYVLKADFRAAKGTNSG